jgi:N-acetylglucosamine malate deacetylase 1
MNEITTLVVAPHADDETFACGGTIARLRDAGRHVEVVVVTEPAEATQRWREFLAAMQILGVAHTRRLGLPEQELNDNPELVVELERIVRACRPTLVLAPHEREFDNDHRVVNRAVRAALFLVRLYEPELQPKLWEYEVWTSLEKPDLLVDITAQVAMKKAAITCYVSQLSDRDYGSATLGLNAFRGCMSGRGTGHAEGFKQRRVV